MKIELPDISLYRKAFELEGVAYPIPLIEFKKEGLLEELPKPIDHKTGWPWTQQTNPGVYDHNKKWPKLTIVTPSYNQGLFIEETIRSVLLQNYPNLEYIIIDGGSTDNSLEIISKYSPWLSYWHHKKDRGQSHAINMGFSLANGDYLAWINSDDYYLESSFFKVIQEFIRHKTSFIYGYALKLTTENQKTELLTIPPLLDYFIRISTLIQPSCFWSATIHQPLWEELNCSLDYEFWLRVVKGQPRRLIKQPLSVANSHINAKTYDPNMSQFWERDHQLICSKEAYGPVYNWDRLLSYYQLYSTIHNWYSTFILKKLLRIRQ